MNLPTMQPYDHPENGVIDVRDDSGAEIARLRLDHLDLSVALRLSALFAASPGLYDALKRLLGAMPLRAISISTADGVIGSGDCQQIDAALVSARAALAYADKWHSFGPGGGIIATLDPAKVDNPAPTLGPPDDIVGDVLHDRLEKINELCGDHNADPMWEIEREKVMKAIEQHAHVGSELRVLDARLVQLAEAMERTRGLADLAEAIDEAGDHNILCQVIRVYRVTVDDVDAEAAMVKVHEMNVEEIESTGKQIDVTTDNFEVE